jgi:3-methyladenine DNA glycosylase AlkD
MAERQDSTEVVSAALADIRAFCQAHADPVQADRYRRFFTEGYDPYGVGKEVFEANRLAFYERYKDQLSLKGFLDLGDQLFRSGKYEEGSFAIVSVVPQVKQMDAEAVQRIGGWLECGVRNWAHTDVICGEILGPCLKNGQVALEDLTAWRQSPGKWKRRAVPVSLLALLREPARIPALLDFIHPLMLDPEKVVHQGLGWFLREAWKKSSEPVEAFLLEWKETAPRVIFQYATEKMTAEQKTRFRRSKRARSSAPIDVL